MKVNRYPTSRGAHFQKRVGVKMIGLESNLESKFVNFRHRFQVSDGSLTRESERIHQLDEQDSLAMSLDYLNRRKCTSCTCSRQCKVKTERNNNISTRRKHDRSRESDFGRNFMKFKGFLQLVFVLIIILADLSQAISSLGATKLDEPSSKVIQEGLETIELGQQRRVGRASIDRFTESTAIEANVNKNNRPTLNHELEEEEETTGSEMHGNKQVYDEINESQLVNTNQLEQAANRKLRIVRLYGPEATQNGTQNVTIDCMFKFDKKLDQRLTVKWFFNDELEPIYQWIPDLNKRVYSDKYERFLDKSYEVSEDIDFMLQAYRSLLSADAPTGNEETGAEHQSSADAHSLEPNRRLLANRLNKLAKLGGRHSRQLLDSLRAALEMEPLEWSRFRALRLIRPTSELAGRFTCSVSSLDGDDLRSTRLVVYEPAKNFTFNVSRISNQLLNLTCLANGIFPQPSLQLLRYRAGPLETTTSGLARQQQQQSLRQNLHRPRLAATLLRQEPIANTQTHIIVGARRQHNEEPAISDPNDISPLDSGTGKASPEVEGDRAASYEIVAWASIEESSLSSNVVTQFECQLSIEGSGYEQRQSLALQRGWHVNSAAITSHTTLLGLFSALASLLCLTLALDYSEGTRKIDQSAKRRAILPEERKLHPIDNHVI